MKIGFGALSELNHISLTVTHPRTWLLLSILFLQIFLLFTIRSLPSLIASTATATTAPPSPSPSLSPSLCASGKVFVYDLPPMFNTELRDNCHDLNPWGSRCAALSNSGFGRSAAYALSGLVPDNLTAAWFWTDQFATELVFHNRILSQQCRTLDPNSATAFYIPFYAGLAVGKYHLYPLSPLLQLRNPRKNENWFWSSVCTEPHITNGNKIYIISLIAYCYFQIIFFGY